MYCIIPDSDNPFFNLALEEVLLKKRDDEFVILTINSDAVVTGKHQVAHREVNSKYTHENKIPVIRRISGGGTVFHDSGNLNFTFIRNSEPGKQVNFQEYTSPVTGFLKSLGVDARFEGKNDIRVNGLKISGNAEHVHRNRVLHHGTLLFSSSLDRLRNSLRKDRSHYTTRAVDSNPSSVTNLADMIPSVKDIEDFRTRLQEYLLSYFPGLNNYYLSENEKDEAVSLAESKFMTWEWNYAYGPEYSFSNEFIHRGIKASCRFNVREGIIRDSVVEGSQILEKISGKLRGCRHMVKDLQEVIENETNEAVDVFNFF
jgi:lipoate-protein ligase A